MIKLGDRITVKPATFDVPGKDGKPKGVPGTVVYIHPAGRYCVLEFDVGRREPVTIRESFQLIDGRVAECSTSNQHRRDTARTLPGR